MPTAIGAYVFAGGFALGTRNAGFDVLTHLEGDGGYGVSVVKLNWPTLPVHFGPANWPIADLKKLPQVDYIFANPPCALFSAMGVRTTRGGADAWRTDSRISCWRDCFGLVESLRPRAWALESVTQAYTAGRELVDELTKRALVMGYSVTHLLVDASWLGVPQRRRRFFLVAHAPSSLTLGLAATQPNWAPPPTVGEVLAEVDDPGEHHPVPERFALALPICRPGEGMTDAFDRAYPDIPKVNGRIRGRPSFTTCRVPIDEPMGSFVTDCYYHPTEDRALGENEHKAICGFPLDFQLDGPPRGRASLLARGVMPPVAQWLGRTIAAALEQGDGSWGDRTVTLVDLRKPNLAPVDLTPTYLDQAGRVRFRIRADGTIITSTPTPAPLQREPVRVGEGDRRSPPPPASIPTPPVPEVEEVPVDATPPPPTLRPLPGEGSGRFVQRLWRATELSPDELLGLVHANWQGRKTKLSDIYYNYRKLLDAGEPVRRWPGRAVIALPSPAPAAQVAAAPTKNRGPRRPRVLVTGCTAKQVGSKKVRLAIVITLGPLVEALKALGYQVDWRPVEPGEDLSGYERCFVALMNPYQISAAGGPYLHGAFWTLAQRPDSVIVIDDHATFVLGYSLKQKWIRDPTFVFRFFDHPAEVRDRIMAAAHRLGDDWEWPTLIAIQGNDRCDHSLLKLPLGDRRPIAWDPTAFCPHYPVIEAPRERRWVSASLNRTDLPATTWPVTVYGNSSGMTQPHGKLAEADVVLEYCRSWAALALPHDHPGSGWWRPRYYFAVDAGCVVSGHPAEAACLGPAYEAATVEAVEAMDDRQLAELALAQAADLGSVTWSRERVQDVLSDLMSNPDRREASFG
jgi:site-specific DNA-cytosine methylase